MFKKHVPEGEQPQPTTGQRYAVVSSINVLQINKRVLSSMSQHTAHAPVMQQFENVN